jgi:hypothetical protein
MIVSLRLAGDFPGNETSNEWAELVAKLQLIANEYNLQLITEEV